MATTPRIRYDIEAAVSGGGDVRALATQLEGLADTLEGDLKVQALASAQALRDLGARQGAIDNFVNLKTQAGEAAARLREAQTAAQQLGQQLAASGAPTRTQAGQMERLRDAVRSAKTELQEKTRALDNSRATLTAYGVSSTQVAAAERNTRQAVAQVREEVARLAPAYTAAGNAAAASGQRQTQAAQATRASLSGIGDTLRNIQSIALTAVGGGFLGGIARDVGAVADSYANLRARLQLVTGEGPALEAAIEAVKLLALETNSELDGTATLFARVLRAGREFGVSQQQALELTRTINQAIQISGGSAEGANAAIIQLVQGLQSGVLRGEEFNSVMEQAPGLALALAQGLGVTTGELRNLANQGRLTTEVVLTALQSQGQAVQAQFDQLPPTIGRALTNLRTQWTAYIGTSDQATGSSQAAARAIESIGNNLDSLVGAAIRAANGVQAAWGVMTAGANGVLAVVLKVGELFASVAGGIQRSAAGIASAFASISFGSVSEGFARAAAEIQLSANATFAAADALNQRAREAFQGVADGAQTARDGWAGLTGEAQAGGAAVEQAANQAAAATVGLSEATQQASNQVRLSYADMTQAIDAARLAKVGDAQASEANLRVQLQLARQSQSLAAFMGDEAAVRRAKIQQLEIEIQLVTARVAVARAEAEGTIAVAQAKLAELAASRDVDLVKQAELENTIKLAQAKLAEADATAQSTELLRRQLEQFRNASTAGQEFGSTLETLTGRQGQFERATRSATRALQEQAAAAADTRFSSPLGDDRFARPQRGSVTGNTREQRLAGQNAVDNSLIFELRDKLNAGTLTADDADDLRNAISALQQNQTIDRSVDRMSAGAFSLDGMRDRNAWAAVMVQFQQALQRTETGRNVNVNLNVGGRTVTVPTTEEGAQGLIQSLDRASLVARG